MLHLDLRFGAFSVSTTLLEDVDVALAIMRDVIVLSAIEGSQAVEYIGWSRHFELLSDTEEMPDYTCDVSEVHGAVTYTWRREVE